MTTGSTSEPWQPYRDPCGNAGSLSYSRQPAQVFRNRGARKFGPIRCGRRAGLANRLLTDSRAPAEIRRLAGEQFYLEAVDDRR